MIKREAQADNNTNVEAPITLKELQKKLKLSLPTLRVLIRTGAIKKHLVGKRKTFYFYSEAVEGIKSL